MLPGVSGFEVCRRIRRDAALFRMPVLIVSAMRNEEEVLHGLGQGADDYIVKPVDVPSFRRRVESLLQSSSGVCVDALTSLPDANGMKREVQRRVSRQETFWLASVELLHLRAFGREAGRASREKAIQWLGRLLVACGERLGAEAFVASHTGGGHFACLLPAAQAKAYCDYVREAWAAQLEALYARVGREKLYAESLASRPSMNPPPPLLDLLCCATRTSARRVLTARELFDVLSRLRHKALSAGVGGVYLDRRA